MRHSELQLLLFASFASVTREGALRVDSESHNSDGLSNVIQSRNDGWKNVKEILNSNNSGETLISTFQNDNYYTTTCHPEMAEKSIERSEIRFLPCSGSQSITPSPAFQAPSPVGRGEYMPHQSTFQNDRGHDTIRRVLKLTPSPKLGEGRGEVTVRRFFASLRMTGKKKIAFTLAEVLITLGIIGVVAAMTIPSVVQKYKKQEVISRLKKVSTELMQVYNLANVEYGVTEREGFEPQNPDAAMEMFQKYYVPYMPFTKVEKGTKGVFAYRKDGTALYFIKAYAPESWAATYILVCMTYKACQNYDEDKFVSSTGVYGANGKDIFGVYIHGGIPTYTLAHSSRETLKQKCKNGGAEDCSALIFNDGWQIKDDYPVKF